MRRVVNDANWPNVAGAVYEIIQDIRPSDVTVNYVDIGNFIDLQSVSQFIRAEINRRFGYSVITFGTTTHSRDVPNRRGRRETTELVFHDTQKQQICGYLSLEYDRQLAVYCWLEDIDHHPLIDYPIVTWSQPTLDATN